MSAHAEATAGGGIRGFVDGLSGAQIDGWAFEPAHPTERVVVELRLEREILATTVADRHRADLVRAGIGDAFHGFRFPLKPAWAERRAELVVVARGVEGGEAALPLFQRGGAPVPAAPNAQMFKAIDQLIAGQRTLDARISDVAAQLATLPVPAAAPPDTALDAEAEQRLAVLEAWVARLDDRLAAVLEAQRPDAAPSRSGLDTWQVVLLALLAVFGLGALAGFAVVLAL